MRRAVAQIALGLSGWAATAVAQGVTVLTEATLPAPVARFAVSGPSGDGALFELNFGFGTSEQPSAGELHDSFTLILTGFLDGRDRVLATLDVFGLTEKPVIEGAGDFSATPVEFHNASLDPLTPFELAQGQAFTMRFPLPPDWRGAGELTAFLASNGDAFKSVGFVSSPLVVPEPGLAGLALAAGALLALAARRNRGALQ